MKQEIKKYTHKNVVFALDKINEDGTYTLLCIYIDESNKVRTATLLSTSYIYDDALNGSTYQRNVLYDCFRAYAIQ